MHVESVLCRQLTILLGHHNKKDTTNAILRDSEKVIAHEKYCDSCRTAENDIGLIKLEGPEISLLGIPIVSGK